jgi:hypothetical protein
MPLLARIGANGEKDKDRWDSPYVSVNKGIRFASGSESRGLPHHSRDGTLLSRLYLHA